MRILIVEKGFESQEMVRKFFSVIGNCDVASSGMDAIEAYRMSWLTCKPYDLICMGIMISDYEREQTIEEIREIEREMDITDSEGIRVIMTSALGDPVTVSEEKYEKGVIAHLYKAENKQGLLENTCVLGLAG